MLLSYKYELRPTIEQKTQLNQAIGACRFVYNLALETKISAYKSGKSYSAYDLMKQMTDLKNECKWLNDVPSQSLQQSLFDLDKAYSNFFKGHNDFPKFKSKHNKSSFRIPVAVEIDYNKCKVKLPKYGWIDFNRDRKINGTIKQATISKTPTGRYFISVLVDNLVEDSTSKIIKEETTIGIDLGIKTFAVLSNGVEIQNPRNTKKLSDKLRVAQRSLSRKKKGSKRRNRQKLKVAKIHEKINNRRSDFLNKLSNEITNQYDTICLETLNVKGMIKNRKLSKHIADVSWSEFNRQLEYKAKNKGKNIVRIGRFEPSSKMCSCGVINKELTLKDREWTCKSCNTTHNRDLLAAQNIKRFGLRTQPNKRQREAIACA